MTNSMNKMMNLINNGVSVSEAMKAVYKTRKVSIPFNDEDFNIFIVTLSLSTRTTNALMRANLPTLKDAIEHINKKGWNSIRSLGRTSATELYEKIVDIAWEFMNNVQRDDFLLDIDNRNVPR